MTLRLARAEDATFLVRVYSSTRDDVARVEWTEAQKSAFLQMQFAAQKADYEGRFPGAEQRVILVGAFPAGRLWVVRGAEEIRLLDLALLPQFRGRGVGTHLVAELQQEAAQGAVLRHYVLSENSDALRFYRRLGFTVTQESGLYLLMEWKADG